MLSFKEFLSEGTETLTEYNKTGKYTGKEALDVPKTTKHTITIDLEYSINGALEHWDNDINDIEINFSTSERKNIEAQISKQLLEHLVKVTGIKNLEVGGSSAMIGFKTHFVAEVK